MRHRRTSAVATSTGQELPPVPALDAQTHRGTAPPNPVSDPRSTVGSPLIQLQPPDDTPPSSSQPRHHLLMRHRLHIAGFQLPVSLQGQRHRLPIVRRISGLERITQALPEGLGQCSPIPWRQPKRLSRDLLNAHGPQCSRKSTRWKGGFWRPAVQRPNCAPQAAGDPAVGAPPLHCVVLFGFTRAKNKEIKLRPLHR